MTASDRCIDMIKSFEGLRLNAYLDAVGVPTIGYGTTEGVKMGDTCTEEEATEYLKRDVRKFENCVNDCVKEPITQNEFDALVCFTYNLGCGALRGSTLLKRLNNGDHEGAAKQFLLWDHAGGKKLAGLTRRREAESILFGAVA